MSRVIPRHTGAVISMIDEARIAIAVIIALEDDGSIASGVIVVFDVNADIWVLGEIWSIESVIWKWAVTLTDKPVRVLINPI